MVFIAYLLGAFYAITFIEAVMWDGAQSTSLSSSLGSNPNPTPKPLIGATTTLVGSNDLRRREAKGGVCGYISGLTGNYKHFHALPI